ncbi:3-hydroxyisobutyryl-CoA hydrolase 1-like protein [Cinnamomum micranthum f. kanehirae]|uniref:3-hydroxyisobutyryl-CoA hydrolase n=1 Tax=Cinnamomum micranthum f. kanehirae TaxID=337451 RepID=A0A3S3NGX5_9MAGN|nr:3-hydroxyisobutyryl-CoA hydrolase 1-like protein [Cinnamomum micranthum f. kanehirae]
MFSFNILVEEKSFVRTLTLNRPQKLNALSYTMISQLLKYFKAYEEDSNVKLVIVKGMGKAFSAGGDAKAAARFTTEGHWTFFAKFYEKQLSLNYVMATYRKPQVSLINGIVMGGGAGASMHGKFRVVTENTLETLYYLRINRGHRHVFAMPETSLGLFPDVGASYFLSRLPGFLGEYLGLTGARMDGAEMLACGLATHFVLSSVREGRSQNIGQCLMREYRMLCHAGRGTVSYDFFEWDPYKLESISEEMVDQYFNKVDEEDWEDLKLPTRGKPISQARSKL